MVTPLGISGVFGGEKYTYEYSNGDRVEYTVTVFECAIVKGIPRNMDGECEELRFFGEEELPQIAVPYPAELFRRYSGEASPAILSRFFLNRDRSYKHAKIPGEPPPQDYLWLCHSHYCSVRTMFQGICRTSAFFRSSSSGRCIMGGNGLFRIPPAASRATIGFGTRVKRAVQLQHRVQPAVPGSMD